MSKQTLLQKGKDFCKKNGGLISTVIGLFLVDRLTKVLAVKYLQTSAIELFPFFHLRYVENTGAAFGMMQGANYLLIVIMLAITAYMISQWKELCSYGKLVKYGCVLVLAGGLGNLYDRIFLGHVVDFLDFIVWPVFNVADSWVTIGGCLFFISLLCYKGKVQRGEK